jgi:hypothetical protein
MKKSYFIALVVALISLFNSNKVAAQSTENGITTIELIQTKNQFYTQKLDLKPGKYQFRIVNKDVDKDLGFVIQKAEDKEGNVMKTAVKNSFTTSLVKKGQAQYTGVIDLQQGEYVYSCPLNPTPHYTISVK